MPATLTLHSMNTLFEDQKSGSGARAAQADNSSPAVNSDDLLKGPRAIAIWHKGAVYRLQETKLGKLILTK